MTSDAASTPLLTDPLLDRLEDKLVSYLGPAIMQPIVLDSLATQLRAVVMVWLDDLADTHGSQGIKEFTAALGNSHAESMALTYITQASAWKYLARAMKDGDVT